MFRPRARYFPGMESTQRSPGLRTRTQGARLAKGLNLFGAGMNLGPFRSPPAAARTGQIRRSFFPHIAPLVCLAFPFPAPFGSFFLFRRARCPHRADSARAEPLPYDILILRSALYPPGGHRPPLRISMPCCINLYDGRIISAPTILTSHPVILLPHPLKISLHIFSSPGRYCAGKEGGA